jgi:hypothetical protein
MLNKNFAVIWAHELRVKSCGIEILFIGGTDYLRFHVISAIEEAQRKYRSQLQCTLRCSPSPQVSVRGRAYCPCSAGQTG